MTPTSNDYLHGQLRRWASLSTYTLPLTITLGTGLTIIFILDNFYKKRLNENDFLENIFF